MVGLGCCSSQAALFESFLILSLEFANDLDGAELGLCRLHASMYFEQRQRSTEIVMGAWLRFPTQPGKWSWLGAQGHSLCQASWVEELELLYRRLVWKYSVCVPHIGNEVEASHANSDAHQREGHADHEKKSGHREADDQGFSPDSLEGLDFCEPSAECLKFPCKVNQFLIHHDDHDLKQ